MLGVDAISSGRAFRDHPTILALSLWPSSPAALVGEQGVAITDEII